jgi:uncharacterized protein with FMN-binding domain
MKPINQRFFAIVTLVAGVAFSTYGFLATSRQRPAAGVVQAQNVVQPRSTGGRGVYATYYAPPSIGVVPKVSQVGNPPMSSGSVPEIPVSTGYVDGVYTGRRESAYYGIIQVQAVVQGGNLTDVRILSYPNDNGTSRYINSVALPRLIKESISAQGSHVNFVSGATFTSEAFHLSLHLALVQAVG